jgi:hypothetical protein
MIFLRKLKFGGPICVAYIVAEPNTVAEFFIIGERFVVITIGS